MACCGVTSPCGVTGPLQPRRRNGAPRSSRNGGHRTTCCPRHARCRVGCPTRRCSNPPSPSGPVRPRRRPAGCPMWAVARPHPIVWPPSSLPDADQPTSATGFDEAHRTLPLARGKSGPHCPIAEPPEGEPCPARCRGRMSVGSIAPVRHPPMRTRHTGCRRGQ